METVPFAISDAAAEKLRSILYEGKYNGIRLAMEPADDGTLAPSMFLVDQVDESQVIVKSKGVSIVMDRQTAEVVEGAQLDFVQEGDEEHFVLSGGLNDASGCGCGDEDGLEGSCGCSD
jgi:iron-sulfur cluster assembly accessory protein